MNMFEAVRCKLTSRKLSAYLDLDRGAVLSESRQKIIRIHLTECEKCREKLAEIYQIRGVFGSVGRSFSEDAERLTKITEKIHEILEGIEE